MKLKIMSVFCCLFMVLMFVSCGAEVDDAGVSDVITTTAWTAQTATTLSTTVGTTDTTISEVTVATTAQPTTAVSYYLETESNNYPKDTEEIEIVFGREDGEGFSYDLHYTLHRLQNGEWEQVPLKPTATFPLITMRVEQGDKTVEESDAKAKLIVDLTAFADPIDVGTYKIEKEFGDASAAAKFTVY